MPSICEDAFRYPTAGIMAKLSREPRPTIAALGVVREFYQYGHCQGRLPQWPQVRTSASGAAFWRAAALGTAILELPGQDANGREADQERLDLRPGGAGRGEAFGASVGGHVKAPPAGLVRCGVDLRRADLPGLDLVVASAVLLSGSLLHGVVRRLSHE